MSKIYMHFIVSPFDASYEPEIYIMDDQNNYQISNLTYLSMCEETIITHNFWMLVESFRKQEKPLPKKIIDLTLLAKIIVGKPKSDFDHMKAWEIWSLVDAAYVDKTELEYIKDCFYSKVSYVVDEVFQGKVRFFLACFKTCTDVQFTALKTKREKNRFLDIELPIYQLMLQRQYDGIKYDNEKLIEKIKTIELEYYTKLKELNFCYSIDENGMSNSKIIDLLKEREQIDFTEYKNYTKNEDYLELLTENSPLIKLVQGIKRLRTDKNALLKFGSLNEDRIFPIFDTHGSVTSRIFIQDPLIQYVRKTSREVLIPDEGKAFIYADYRQFEPGILASLSRDGFLINMYNSDDIYTALSQAVFENKDHRKICKKLFLAYSFGMTQEGMIKFLKVNNSLKNIEDKVSTFFSKFEHIEAFKEALYSELLDNSRIASTFGNFRYRKFSGPLKAEEKRWCLSQKIQGTASLILKRVILSIKTSYPEIDILIPMHDALLVQVDDTRIMEYKEILENVFVTEFKVICPDIIPKVSFEKF